MPVQPLLLHRMALVSFRLYVSEKFGQLARIFWANGLPPPLAKNFPYAYANFKSENGSSGLETGQQKIIAIADDELHNLILN